MENKLDILTQKLYNEGVDKARQEAENIINQAQDRLGGETAMGFIQNTHPIVIIDEPQSVDNTPKKRPSLK